MFLFSCFFSLGGRENTSCSDLYRRINEADIKTFWKCYPVFISRLEKFVQGRFLGVSHKAMSGKKKTRKSFLGSQSDLRKHWSLTLLLFSFGLI